MCQHSSPTKGIVDLRNKPGTQMRIDVQKVSQQQNASLYFPNWRCGIELTEMKLCSMERFRVWIDVLILLQLDSDVCAYFTNSFP